MIDGTDAVGGAPRDARVTRDGLPARKGASTHPHGHGDADYALLVRALRGFVPSIVAIGLTRAWLSFQTGVCLSYDTPFASRGDLVLVQHLSLVALSILATLVGLAVARPGCGPLSLNAVDGRRGRLRGIAVVLAGVVGCLRYVAGLLLAPASSLMGAVCVVLMIAAFMTMLWV